MASLSQILNKIKKDVQKSLENEVANEIKQTMKEHIQTDVYDAYSPKEYIRRREQGGLLDDNNIKHSIKKTNDSTFLEVWNETKGIEEENGYYFETYKRLDWVIEYGIGYEWEKSDIYKNQPYPRPFINNTNLDLKRSNKPILALKSSLKNKGYDIK